MYFYIYLFIYLFLHLCIYSFIYLYLSISRPPYCFVSIEIKGHCCSAVIISPYNAFLKNR